jgi:glutamyl-tRNA synthetase
MGVTQVLRGDDHLTNTPRQLLILDALGMRKPGYGHVGLLVGADGAPLSKRHGSTSVQEFRQRGFLSIAVLNHLFRLGHASDVDPWLSVQDMPAHFRPEHLGRAPARFDESQLIHWQKESLARLSAAEFARWLGSGDDPAFVELIRHNVVLPADAQAWRAVVKGQLAPLGAAEQQVIAAAGPGFFAAAAHALEESQGDFKRFTAILKQRSGRKGADLFMPLRAALTGQVHGPELAPLLKLIPPATIRQRLEIHAQNTQ